MCCPLGLVGLPGLLTRAAKKALLVCLSQVSRKISMFVLLSGSGVAVSRLTLLVALATVHPM